MSILGNVESDDFWTNMSKNEEIVRFFENISKKSIYVKKCQKFEFRLKMIKKSHFCLKWTRKSIFGQNCKKVDF